MLKLIFVIMTASVTAQETTFSIADLPPYILNREWGGSSTGFAFQNPDVGPDKWFSIDITSHELREGTTYPLSPTLSDAELQIFQTTDVIRASPDGQLLLYAIETATSEDGSFDSFHYVLANRNTQQTVTTSVPAANEVNVGNSVNVIWSNNSSGVSISTPTWDGTNLIYFIAIPDPQDLQTIVVSQFEAVIDGHQYYTGDPFINRLFDMSLSGQVLLSVQQDYPNLNMYYEPTFFVLWNPHDSSVSQIIRIPEIDAAMATVAFSPFSENQVLIWQPDGFGTTGGTLYTYDLITHEHRRLQQIDPAYEPLFSPDGEWLSYSNDHELVFLRLEELGPGMPVELPPMAVPTPTTSPETEMRDTAIQVDGTIVPAPKSCVPSPTTG